MRSIRTVAAVTLAALAALVLGACGSSTSGSGTAASGAGAGVISTGGFQTPTTESLSGKRGGTLQVLDETEFENLDPGVAYYSLDYQVVFATQRPLYSHKPGSTEPTPDTASGAPEISANNKTVTVHLKEGIHFSPPVNREVTSEDVAYAIERGANPNVANPYFQSYFEAIEGAPKADGGPIKGIETPSKHEIIFHLTEPKGQLVADALVLPLTAAVPQEYAEKYDKNKPSDYVDYQVATGPYMLKNDSAGKVLGVGYVPGKSATLVRNPNWNPATDFRPAYLNEIDIKIGGTKTIIGRQVLEGTNVVENELPVQSIIKLAAEHYKSQLEISPGAGSHYIAINNKVGPFSNINLRKALWAALDRTALDKARGGELVTNVATHFIYPTIPGFEQAGGLKGLQVDYNEHPEGDPAIAEKYIKLAGYPSGKYTGGKTLQVVGASNAPEKEDAEIVNQALEKLGFTTKLTLVEQSTMYSKYCGVPKEEIDVCPSVAWGDDFPDPQTVLDITFNGKFINAISNNNWGQTNVPKINAAMTAAEDVVGIGARATAWAKIDNELVEDAAAIPFDWDKDPNIEGNDVHGVGDIWNEGDWDYDYTSLK
jgi:peptide/nickel transport system substrate-binding protein